MVEQRGDEVESSQREEKKADASAGTLASAARRSLSSCSRFDRCPHHSMLLGENYDPRTLRSLLTFALQWLQRIRLRVKIKN
jgi:hypothetical protein